VGGGGAGGCGRGRRSCRVVGLVDVMFLRGRRYGGGREVRVVWREQVRAAVVGALACRQCWSSSLRCSRRTSTNDAILGCGWGFI